MNRNENRRLRSKRDYREDPGDDTCPFISQPHWRMSQPRRLSTSTSISTNLLTSNAMIVHSRGNSRWNVERRAVVDFAAFTSGQHC